MQVTTCCPACRRCIPTARSSPPFPRTLPPPPPPHGPQLEHILLRPDTYIGSTEKQEQQLWVHDGERMVFKTIKFVPGLYKVGGRQGGASSGCRRGLAAATPKAGARRAARSAPPQSGPRPSPLLVLPQIFDEILVNAADNKVRDATMDTLRVDIDPVGAAGSWLAARMFWVHAGQGVRPGSCTAPQRTAPTPTLLENTPPGSCLPQVKGSIKVLNNGAGIPVEVHKTEVGAGCWGRPAVWQRRAPCV